jgi:adenylate cyclase
MTNVSSTVAANGPGPTGLRRSTRTVLFADVVESVRLIEADEEATVRRWIGFVDALEAELTASGRGRLVKRLGDGLMLEFDDPGHAVRCAFGIRDQLEAANDGLAQDRRIEIRMGLDLGAVLESDDLDLYGQHVNIAARLAATAPPGGVTASAAVRDALAGGIDAVFEDLGPIYLKNVADPVHAFQVAGPDEGPRVAALMPEADLRPTVAVLPLLAPPDSEATQTWGELATEDLILGLSRSELLNVISRLSTAGIEVPARDIAKVGALLGADFILSGRVRPRAGQLRLDLELARARDGRVVWSDSVTVRPATLLEKNTVFSDVAAQIHTAILATEMRRALSHPLPTLESYALLSGAVALMHRLSPRDFARAGEMLDALIARIPTAPEPLAQKARWHVLRVGQGWSDNPREDVLRALDAGNRALDLDPENTGALVAAGFVKTNLEHDLDEAEDLYDSALAHNPNDAPGRALRGTLHAFRGDGDAAVADCERALALTPLDPNRFFFLAMAAGARLAAGDNARALDLAESSQRLNRAHLSTLRIRAVAEARLGLTMQANRSVAKLMRLQPRLTVSGWLKAAPSAPFPVGQAFAQSLRDLGVPE